MKTKSGNRSINIKRYGYGCMYTFIQTVGGWFFFGVCVLVFVGVPVFFIRNWFRGINIDWTKEINQVLLFQWVLSAPIGAGALAYANFLSPILVSERYMIVYFCFRKMYVLWEHILEMKNINIPGNRGVLVKVARPSLPWVYWFYGATLGYLGGRYIPISSYISDYRFLLREIKTRSPNLNVS